MTEPTSPHAEKDPLEYLALLQHEAEGGWHLDLRLWVDDHSGAAKALRSFAAYIPADQIGDTDG